MHTRKSMIVNKEPQSHFTFEWNITKSSWFLYTYKLTTWWKPLCNARNLMTGHSLEIVIRLERKSVFKKFLKSVLIRFPSHSLQLIQEWQKITLPSILQLDRLNNVYNWTKLHRPFTENYFALLPVWLTNSWKPNISEH